MAKSEAVPAPAGPKFHKPQYEVPAFGDFFGDDMSGLACLTNDNIESPEGRLRYQKALERSVMTTAELMASHFDVVLFYVFQVESRTDDGEVTGGHYRIVFMNGAGDTYETHSDTASRSLQTWIASNGWGQWEPPVRFTVEQKQGKSQRTYHQLRLVGSDGYGPSTL